MPVRKYHSVEEMAPLPALAPLDGENLRRAFELMDLAARLFQIPCRPGVRKFHSVEEAVEHRENREMEAIRARRGPASGTHQPSDEGPRKSG